MSGGTLVAAPHRSLEWCRAIVRKRAGNFYWGLRLLPDPKRSALFALYAWMRRADDIADDAVDIRSAQDQLAVFGARTREILSGEDPGDEELWQAMAWVARNWSLPAEPFEEMLRGQADDLSDRTIETTEDLLDYCRCVASTVGVLCVTIWGYHGDEALDLAIERGVALQLTNVLRDVGEDVASGRCYLPAEDLRVHGLSASSLVSWQREDVCESFIRRWIDTARACYDVSLPLDDMVSKDCRPTLRAMTGIYRALLDRIDAAPRRVTSVPGVSISKLAKIMIAIRSRRGSS
ncbi:MAG: squalene/phytoene synthase family protein [Planctomycetes bacterium]|nr:squalene/phytoene synthase family protein [Planctomycetota bacterium]MCP4839071.1 squalene/phytoene synthase family protein [Planctomycetota bacterium]